MYNQYLKSNASQTSILAENSSINADILPPDYGLQSKEITQIIEKTDDSNQADMRSNTAGSDEVILGAPSNEEIKVIVTTPRY